VEVVASLSQGRTVAAQCGLFTHKSVLVIFETPCIYTYIHIIMRFVIPVVFCSNSVRVCILSDTTNGGREYI